MDEIAKAIQKLKKEMGAHVQLVAVSKTKPEEAILAAYEAGQKVFGENKARELESKAKALPKDIEWHMIGHLQSNKVKYIAPYVNLIHSVDKFKLLKEINKRAKQNERIIQVLLQIHIAKEESKFGLNVKELQALLKSESLPELKHIQIAGLMGMATLTENKDQIKAEFDDLKQLFDQTKAEYFSEDERFNILSMGMSNDYQIALKAGSNMLRIGSAIFGRLAEAALQKDNVF